MLKKTGLLLAIFLSLISAGCWNKKEPKDLAIAESVLYDRTADGCRIVTEFMDLKGSSEKESKASNTTVISQGSTYRDAVTNSANSINKTIYGGHVYVRFLSEATARQGIAGLLDFVLRDHLTDETPLIMVVKGDDPVSIYQCDTGLSDSVGVYIKGSSVSQTKATSTSVFPTTLNFVKDFLSDAKQPVAGVVNIVSAEEEKPSGNPDGGSSSGKSGRILVEGLAAFRDDKLVGFFNAEETRAYNIILGEVRTAVISVPFLNSYVVCEVTKAAADITAKIENNGFTFNVKIKASMRILANATEEDISEADATTKIEKAFNEYLLPQIASAVEKAQREFKSDIFGFGKSVHKQYPDEWKKIRKEWDDIFSKSAVTISVESSVYQTGEIRDSLLSEFSED